MEENRSESMVSKQWVKETRRYFLEAIRKL
jgi:hypothetical protein